eukprot:377428_1
MDPKSSLQFPFVQMVLLYELHVDYGSSRVHLHEVNLKFASIQNLSILTHLFALMLVNATTDNNSSRSSSTMFSELTYTTRSREGAEISCNICTKRMKCGRITLIV